MSKFNIYAFIIIVALVFIKLWKRRSHEKKSRNYQEIAQQLGWHVDNRDRLALYNRVKQFKLFQWGNEKKILAVLSGQQGETQFNVISVRHGSSTGGVSSGYMAGGSPSEYVALLIEDTERTFPALALRNKRAGVLLWGMPSLAEFGDYPALKNYGVQSEQPDMARTVLQPAVLNAFAMAAQSNYLFEMEIGAGQFLCYLRVKGEGKIEAQSVQQLVEQGVQIYRQL